MNLLIVIAFATSAIIAVNSVEYQKLGSRKWSELSSEPIEGQNQFYEGIFRARLDHFRPQNQERVDFTYHVNANYYNTSGGPLYVYLKDYRDYSTRWIEEGLMHDIARETGAALLTFDYRYFGVNQPTESATFDEFEYLSVEQILADVADFSRFIRTYIGNGQYAPIILYGSGFGGVLSAWARSRYPHLIDAAWSSSGYVVPQLSSYGPYDYFEHTFAINDDGYCTALIRNAYDIIAYLVINHQGEYLSQRMNLCHPVETDNEADVASLYELTIRAVLFYINDHHYTGVRAFCSDLAFIPGDALNSFARWIRYVYGDGECFDHSYDSMIELTSNSTWGSWIGGRRQWYYLQCTQMGSFLLADTNTWLPGVVTLDFHLQKCADVFGVDIDLPTLSSAFHSMLDEYNQAITNVVYTNGYLDPFRYFGRLYDTTGAGIVINMDYAAHSADLRSQSLNDPLSIYEAKGRIRDLVLRWSGPPGPPVGPPGTGLPPTAVPPPTALPPVRRR